MELLSFHLGLEKLKDRIIKLSTMSQVFAQPLFQSFL
jgi:hypothetical protein